MSWWSTLVCQRPTSPRQLRLLSKESISNEQLATIFPEQSRGVYEFIEPSTGSGNKAEGIMTDIAGARKLMERTRAEKFAVGAFNVDNQETLKAIAQAAANKKSPVMVEVSKDETEMI